MKKINHPVPLSVLLVIGLGTVAATLTSSCAAPKTESSASQEQIYGPRIGTVLRLAEEAGVKERHMMAAGFISGYFGLTDGQKSQAWLSDSGRSPSVGLDVRKAGEAHQQNFRGQMDLLAKEILQKAERQQPTNDFDWLTVIAQAIVGEFETDPNIQALLVRVVLMELIEANNNGFSAILSDSETYTVPPATDVEKIDLRTLDPGQLRILNGFRFQGDGLADLLVEGNNNAKTGNLRNFGNIPKLVIRLCPSTTLLCFEALRKSATLGAHFLSYKTMNGSRETVQFHDPKYELNWHNEPQKDTVTLVLSGVTGLTRQTTRPDLFDWEDFVSLRGFIRRAAGRLTQEIASENPANVQREFIRNSVLETLGLIDDNAPEPKFNLGPSWDSALFRELLQSESLPKQMSQIKIEQPTHGQLIPGTVIEGVIYPDPESGQIQIFQDSSDLKTEGSSWELVLKRDLDPRSRRFDFSHEIRRMGLTGNQWRALKVVNRKSDGTLLGSRIIRLRVQGVERP